MRLLQWDGPRIDPGSSGTQTVEDDKQTHVFTATFDEPVPIDFIYEQRQCPKFFDSLVHNGRVNQRLFVVGRDARQKPDAPQCYEVRIEYANKWTNSQNADKPNVTFSFILDPTLRPALVTGSSYVLREAVEFDEDNQFVGTTAGEPLILEEEYHRRRLTINKNVKNLPEWMQKGDDYINEEDTKINGVVYSKHTLWLWPIDFGHISVENGFYYFPIVITILHNPKTWLRRVRNAGYYMKAFNSKFRQKGANARVPIEYFPMEPIRFKNGTKADRPMLLDKEGRPLQAVITGEIPDPDQINAQGIPVNPLQPGAQVRKIKTYDILSPEDFGRHFTKDELEQSKLKFRTRKFLNFTKSLPLS